MSAARFWSAIDRLLPSEFPSEDPEYRRRAQLLAVGVVISVLAALGGFVQYLSLGSELRGWFSLAVAGPVLATLALLHATRSVPLAANFFLAVILASLTASPFLSPSREAVQIGICVVGFSASFVVGPTAGAFWTFVGIALLGVISAFTPDPDMASLGWTAMYLTAALGFSGVVIEYQRRTAIVVAQRERDRLRSLGEAAFAWIIETEGNRIVYASDALEKISGFKPSEVLGRDLSEYVHPDDWEKLTAWRSRIATESALTTRVEHRAKDRDGGWHWCETFAIVHHSSERWTFAARPIDLERRERNRVRTHERLQGLARLTAGVAHDFNNLLTVIGGHAGLLEESESREEIVRATSRAARLTSQLMSFGKGQRLSLRVLDIPHEVQQLHEELALLAGPSIELRLDPNEGALCARAGESSLKEILSQLVRNARDAMPRRGTIEIRVQSGSLTDGRREAVVITVRDDGKGMEPAVLDQAIDPFFTTKPQGQGAGLGLASVYGSVVQLGGEFDLQSEPERGTRAIVRLPRVREVAATAPAPDDGAKARRERSRACLVEDNRPIRALMLSTLERAGFDVVSFADGESALASLDRIEDCALLVTDMVMPGASGADVATAFRARHPEVRVLFVSGYTEEMIQPPREPADRVAFLEKPFSMRELQTRVDSLLAP